MIFYHARDERGHLHLAGTQADAKAIDRKFVQIDIPTDKAGLMAFVQGLYAEIDQLKDQIAEGGEGLHADPAPLDSRRYAPPEPVTLTDADLLPSEDEDIFDAQVLENQVNALGLLGVEALNRFDGWMELTGISAAFSRGVHLLNILAADDHQIAKLFLRDRLKKRRRFG